MFFVGLDVHLGHTTMCVLDKNGGRIKQLKIHGPWSGIVEELQELKGSVSVCYEASCGYGHIYELLKPVCQRVVVAHPGQLRLIFRSKRKNDRVDAEKLAKLLFLNEVPGVYVPSGDVRAWRQLIEYRTRVIDKRTRAKNSLRGLLRSLGITVPREFGLWSRPGLLWLERLELPSALYAMRRDLLIEELRVFTEQLQRVEKQLHRHSQTSGAVALLVTIPGVGPRTAEAMAAYLDDPHRFRRTKSIGCYFGLVPAQDQSGSMNRLGHITREGPATARKLLTEAAWQGVRRSPTIRKFFERIQQGADDRKKIALVATAHYLARVMHAMLRKGQAWQEQVLVA
jgi:transposase